MIDFEKVYEEKTGKKACNENGIPTVLFYAWLYKHLNKSAQVLIELYASAQYWSEYDVPIGIADRIKNDIEQNTGKDISIIMQEYNK